MTLWGGRFKGKLDQTAWVMNASLPFDQRLASQDVLGSMAWAGALMKAGVLSIVETATITTGLETILAEFESGDFAFSENDEDIHTAVERRLGELIGAVAGKLHTGRSRNDQVATDFRLWLLDEIPGLDSALQNLQKSLVEQAEANQETLIPGYTHMQRAQPITLAHWFLSHFWALQRDRERLLDLCKRTSVMPLGSGALAGTAFPIDREALAESLGFDMISPNSLDAVSDRDFAAEFLFCAAMTGVHISKLCEAVVLFSSAEFGFFELSDAYSTGSSLMPQKKNPDLFELGRGKAGVLVGLLSGLLTTLKGLPSTYDKDLQEDKVPVFQALDTLLAVLPALAGAIATITARHEKMRTAIDASMLATDLADMLVGKGMPFREAHGVVGRLVREAAEKDVSLEQQVVEERQALGLSEGDVIQCFDPLESVKRRNVIGGAAPEAVKVQLAKAKELTGWTG
ncbi:MAG: argininosuccinate lyase [Anaerolineales bacterium]|nr:argininosuccinate lyase [Anaerolineales bacterium]